MRKAQAVARLAQLGFVIDFSVTQSAEGYWSGVMDAMGRGQIDGDCRGEAVFGDTAADFYRNAVAAAEAYARHGPNRLCTDPECDFHADEPVLSEEP